MGHHLTNTQIKLTLSDLRSKIRNGVVTVSYKTIGSSALKDIVASKFGVLDFNKHDFNPQTLRRFEVLFDVPKPPTLFGTLPDKMLWPTQDDTATALQNFINRRSDPWAHVKPAVVTVDIQPSV